MQRKIDGYLNLSIPPDMLEEAGIDEESVIQMSVADGKILIEAVDRDDTEDYVCDMDCENCPCAEDCEESEVNGHDHVSNFRQARTGDDSV